MKGYHLMPRHINFLVSLTILFCCTNLESPYDPASPNYNPPTYTIVENESDIADGDTTTQTAVRLVLKPNQASCLFRWRLDSTEWSEWTDADAGKVNIQLIDLDTGMYNLEINTTYHRDNSPTASMISFYRASLPRIEMMADTVVEKIIAEPCTLWVDAEGSCSLAYQ